MTSWTLTTSAAAIAKAGYGANSTIVASTATLARWSDDAEGELNAATRYDWVTNIGSVGTYFKPILSQAVSSLVANEIIKYNMAGYTSRFEAQTMLDVNVDNYKRCVEILKDEKNKEKM